MTKFDVFNSYLSESNIPKNLYPIELYFMKYRAQSISKSENSLDAVKVNQNIDIKPNYLTKIAYFGDVHSLPTSSLSLIINNENLI